MREANMFLAFWFVGGACTNVLLKVLLGCCSGVAGSRDAWGKEGGHHKD